MQEAILYTPRITALLAQMRAGDQQAVDRLADGVYQDLRAMAERHMHREPGGRLEGVTLQPTMLATDTFLKLIKQRRAYDSRGHFFALATKLMIRVLIDYHRQRNALKRGGAAVHVELAPEHQHSGGSGDFSHVIEALKGLEIFDARKADVVKLRVFWGLTVAEVAETLGVSETTIERDWRFARAWLSKELEEA